MYKKIAVPLLFFCITLIYLFPLLQGLILLPVDLLISNYGPWSQPGTILLKNPYMQDSVIQLFPWKHLVYQSLTQGIIPFWNPYQHLGTPFMANVKSMVFYPLNIFFIFGEIKAWNMLLFSQLFLGMLFAYYLARDFKLKFFPSLLTSFAFGLNSYMIGLLEFGSDAHTILWWPLILLFSKRYLEKQEKKYLLLTGVTLSVSFFAGQLQYLGYFIILLFSFIVYYGKSVKTNNATYFYLFVSILLGLGICSVQLLPSIELFNQSHRGLLSNAQKHQSFSNGLILPHEHFRLLAPDIFGNPVTRDATAGYIETSGYFGIISLFFALFAMFFARKNSYVKFFTASFILALLFSLQGIGETLYLLKIPLITNGQGDRIFTLVLFSGSLLAGFGLSEFIAIENKKKKLLSILVFLVFSFAVFTGFALFLEQTTISSPLFQHIKFSLIILIIFFIGSIFYLFPFVWKKYTTLLTTLFLVLVVGLVFVDLFRLGYRFLTFSNEKFIYPQMDVTKFIQNETSKTLARTYGITEPELGTYLNIYTIETYNPLYLLRTSTILQTLQHQSPENLSPDNKYFLTSTGKELKQTLDFLGTDYVVATIAENPSTKYFNTDTFQDDFKKIYSDERYAVYKNLQAYPRFGLYYHADTINDDKSIIKAMTSDLSKLKNTIILEDDLPFSLQEGTGSAKLIASTVNTQTFSTNTDKPALFYISDTFYPGWKAKVNDKETKIYRANYNFRAIVIPPGESMITFTYEPAVFKIGLWTTAVSLFLLIFLTMIPYKKK